MYADDSVFGVRAVQIAIKDSLWLSRPEPAQMEASSPTSPTASHSGSRSKNPACCSRSCCSQGCSPRAQTTWADPPRKLCPRRCRHSTGDIVTASIAGLVLATEWSTRNPISGSVPHRPRSESGDSANRVGLVPSYLSSPVLPTEGLFGLKPALDEPQTPPVGLRASGS